MQNLPTGAILTTGGAIASRPDPATDAVQPLVFSGHDLLAALPQAAVVATVEVEEEVSLGAYRRCRRRCSS